MQQQTNMYSARKKFYSIFSIILSIAGLLISAYLFYQHYLFINEANGKADVCYAVFGKGCTRALASAAAVQLGLPLAGWGIIYYTVLIALLLLPAFVKVNKDTISIVVFAITLAGCTSSIMLLVMIYFDHSLFCPFCVMIHGINLALFLISALIVYSSGFLISSRKYFNTLFTIHPVSNKNAKIKFAAVFIIVIIFLYTVLQVILMPGKVIFDAKKFISDFDSTSQQKIMVDKDDPVLGSANAPVELTVFSDFECPACRNFSKVITQLNKKYQDKLYVVFKNFPLGKECNPIFGDYDLHPKACEAARAAEAANLQQKFWPYHDILFSVDLKKTKETFSSLAANAGLNQAQFETDRKGEIVMARLTKTIEQGKRLGIKSTPAVFVNGRLVSDSRLRHMQVLMDHLLK